MPDSVTPTPYHHFIPTPGISPLPTPGTSPVTVSQMDVTGAVLPLLMTVAVGVGIVVARWRKR